MRRMWISGVATVFVRCSGFGPCPLHCRQRHRRQRLSLIIDFHHNHPIATIIIIIKIVTILLAAKIFAFRVWSLSPIEPKVRNFNAHQGKSRSGPESPSIASCPSSPKSVASAVSSGGVGIHSIWGFPKIRDPNLKP